MKEIKVSLNCRQDYSIIIGNNLLKNIPAYLNSLKLPKEIFIVTNTLIKKKYGKELSSSLRKGGFSFRFYTVIDSEKAKSISSAVRLVETLADYARHKKITVFAFGGGVVGDLASFIASIYKRGVPLVHIPTTLLAQIDSSIGGKTAIDLTIAKNLVGTFYQPRLVVCDLRLLASLDKRQIRSGLAEAIKYAVIKDRRLFSFLEQRFHSIFSLDIPTLEHLVYECARIKAKIVELDEKEEKGIRTILNFGHTIGHAIESAGGYTKYSHGEAIALGMIAASRISRSLGLLHPETLQRVLNLITNIGLPQEISDIREKDVLRAYKLDKKFIGRTNRLVLLKDIGRTSVCQNISEKAINNAIRELFIL